MTDLAEHYATEPIDPLLIAAARDQLTHFVRGPSVANIGLGYGTWDAWLASSGHRVTGIDIDADSVERFKAKHPSAAHPQIAYVHADATRWVPPARFDTVIASHVLEHFDDPLAALTLWRRQWLAPAGRLIVVVPNADSLHRHLGQHMKLLGARTDLSDSDRRFGHRRVYTVDLLKAQLRAASLNVKRIETLTLKPLTNGQLQAMPPAYLEACAAMRGSVIGQLGAQIAALATVRQDTAI